MYFIIWNYSVFWIRSCSQIDETLSTKSQILNLKRLKKTNGAILSRLGGCDFSESAFVYAEVIIRSLCIPKKFDTLTINFLCFVFDQHEEPRVLAYLSQKSSEYFDFTSFGWCGWAENQDSVSAHVPNLIDWLKGSTSLVIEDPCKQKLVRGP